MCSIVNNQNNLCILHVWTGSLPDINRARSVSMLCTVPSYGLFPLHSRHIRGSSCRSARLQATWLDSNADTSLLQIDDYTLISQGTTCSSHGGLLIYLHKHYKYTHLVGETSNIWEGQFIRVTDEETNTHVTIGNIYRPPRDVNENYQQFTEEFTRQLAKFQKSKGEVIIAGDYNIDLLKINNKPKITEYFDSILEHSFFPKNHIPY